MRTKGQLVNLTIERALLRTITEKHSLSPHLKKGETLLEEDEPGIARLFECPCPDQFW